MLLTYKEKSLVVVRSRGLEPPRVAPLAPQASASTNSATTANERGPRGRAPKRRARCNKSTPSEQGPRAVLRPRLVADARACCTASAGALASKFLDFCRSAGCSLRHTAGALSSRHHIVAG